MSGKPHPAGAKQLRETAIAWRQASREALRLQELISQSQEGLVATRREQTRLQEELIKQLTAMDCAANGNMGWEHRIAWLLAEISEASA